MKEAILREALAKATAYPHSHYGNPVPATERRKPPIVYMENNLSDDRSTSCHGIKITLDRDADLTPFAMDLLRAYYMREGEKSPQEAFARAAVAYCDDDLDFAQRIYDYASKGWFMFASPVLSNAVLPGEKWKALPISCFLTYVPDTLEGLISHTAELRWLSVKGGGVGGHWSAVRSVSGKSPGPIPFLKTVDADMTAYRQGTCYTPDTEVMTEHGWVRFDLLDSGVKVGQVTSDMKVVFDPPLEIVVEDHVGDILNIRTPNGSVDLAVTPNHSMVLEQRVRVDGKKKWSGVLKKRRADELPRHADARFHTSAWSSCTGPTTLAPEERFHIAFQADGHNHARGGGCSFHFKKTRKIERVREILDACGYSYREVDASDGSVKVYVHAPITGDKTFAWVDLANISPEWGVAFLDELRQWDATSRGDGHAGFTYFTTDKGNADLVQAVAALSGRTSRMSVREASGNRKDLWKVYIRPNQHLTLQKVEVTSSPYEGKVYCATVSTGMLLVRRSGVVTVCGNTRKGSYAAYLDVSHPDVLEFLQMRLPTGGDPNRKCLNLHNALNITDEFMQACIEGGDWNLVDPADGAVRDTMPARELFERILEVRSRTGEPYLFFIDTANRALPKPLKDLGLKINGSNLCIEIMQPTAEDRTAVCCLSSLNLALYDEWKGTSLVRDLIRLLDNVLQVFIDNAPDDISRARLGALRERSIGLGAMGFHAYLQKQMVPWESAMAKGINLQVFQNIQNEAISATAALAVEKGEYPDGIGSGRRNAHLLAIAPNANSSILLNISPSIEPWKSNAYTHRTRAGSHQVRNPALEALLEERIVDPTEREKVWSSITTNAGSVQHLDDDLLSEWEKEVFKTAFELDQRWVVSHAADRQPFICQGQSVNLFFPAGADRHYVLMTHIKAWKEGLKGLYYLRTTAGVDADKVSAKVERVALKDYVEAEECLSCQG